MSSPTEQTSYYIPHGGWYPVWVAASAFLLVFGLGLWLNDLKAAEEPNRFVFYVGAGILTVVLFAWFSKVVRENLDGLTSPQLHRSYIWGMSWFIFSEIMFFAAFFGALFYTRVLVVSWLGGEGEKGITGDYLWPEFEANWPVVNNPDPNVFDNPRGSMASPGISNWGTYLPFWNTAILLISSFTVHFAHTAIKNAVRWKLLFWLGLTVVLGIGFLILQVEEYLEAYQDLGLTLSSGIYGSTFFLLTGFHGFHVTLGTFMLFIQLIRAFKGHFQPKDCFGFEASSWYWHFVDVVWVCLFLFVYVF
ncbi:MAG: cytochrome c oxidase subunit 3 [Gammaproteobacteria bacterium]|nr:cytochrome c oxidase subunit 3 [Gammaproteobacteria bacterium]